MLHHRAVGRGRWTFGTAAFGRASAQAVGRYRPAGRRGLSRRGRGSTIHDFRGLEPPEPLLATLALLDQRGPAQPAVVVMYDREPHLLFPELHQRGWHCRVARDPRGVIVRMWPGRPGAPS